MAQAIHGASGVEMGAVMGRRWAQVLVLGVVSSGWVGCAGLENTLEKGHAIAANLMIPPAEEVKLGRRLSKELEKSIKIHDNEELQTYIQELGARIAANVEVYEPIEFTFKVVDDPGKINASALPGGHIYVYTGLIMMVKTEAELAAVVSHEIAHVTERHIPQRLVALHGLEALQELIFEQDTVPPLLTALASEVAGGGYLLHYSRETESEADVVGIGYTIKAGFNPERFVDFFTLIKRLGAQTPEIFSTHPDPDRRIQDVRKAIGAFGEVPSDEGGEGFKRVHEILWGPAGRPDI